MHIYGLMRAGYVPQTFSLVPVGLEALDHLLNTSGARALVYQEGLVDWVVGLVSNSALFYSSKNFDRLDNHE